MQENESGQLEREPRLLTGRVGCEAVIPEPMLKLLDQAREVLRMRHYPIRPECSYCDWIRRYFRFHRLKPCEEPVPGTAKVQAFMSDVARI